MEWVEGWSVREVLGGGAEGEVEEAEDEREPGEEEEKDVGELLEALGLRRGASNRRELRFPRG